MKKLFLIFMLVGVTNSSYAELANTRKWYDILDVSSFDISDIKLGDKYKSTYNKVKASCSPSGFDTNTQFLDNKKPANYEVMCDDPVNHIYVRFDQNNKVYSVSKTINFQHKPNATKLKRKLKEKYGDYTDSARLISNSLNPCEIVMEQHELVWSDIGVEREIMNYWDGLSGAVLSSVSKGSSLYVLIDSNPSCRDSHSLYLRLKDHDAYKKLEAWIKQKNNEYKNNIESTVTF